MAALGRPFSGLPLSGGAEFLQPPPAFAGRAFAPGPDGAELAPRAGPRVVASSPGGSAARGRFMLHCKKKHKREEEDDDESLSLVSPSTLDGLFSGTVISTSTESSLVVVERSRTEVTSALYS